MIERYSAAWTDPYNHLPKRGYRFSPEQSVNTKKQNLLPDKNVSDTEWGVWLLHDSEENHFKTLGFSEKTADLLSLVCVQTRWPVRFTDNNGRHRFKDANEVYKYIGMRIKTAISIEGKENRKRYLADLTIGTSFAELFEERKVGLDMSRRMKTRLQEI